MVWLPDGEKSKIRSFASTEFTNVTDVQTDGQKDGQTLHDGIVRACIASRGKKYLRAVSIIKACECPS